MKALSLLVLTFSLVFPVTISTAVASDKTYNIDQLTYENEGGYNACVYLHWKIDDDNTQSEKVGCADLNENKTARPSDYNVSQGNEVWLVIHITDGDTVSCKKSDHKYIYEDNDYYAEFKTKGTTDNDNHCQIVCDHCSKN